MEQSVHLGRIRGIEIGANWSLLLIATLITWTLARDVLPALVPGRSAADYWTTSVVTAVLFYGSLVLHELSHAFVARRHGVEVRQITLWLFGGVAKMESESTDPQAELRIGGIGPLVSIGLGLIALPVALILALVPLLELAAAAIAWLAMMNLMLGVFNLLPAFPLDGGRVLRAMLWRHSGDHLRATERSGRIGIAFGYGLAGVGLALLVAGLLPNGLWLLFLGWFLVNAARAEVFAVTQSEVLKGVDVGHLMSSPPIVVPSAMSVADVLEDYVLRFRHSAYPVVMANGDLVGLVTLDRVRAVPTADRPTVPVGRIAFGMDVVPVAAPDDAAMSLLPRLASSPTRRALVVDAGVLVGVVSLGDIAKAIDLRTVARSEQRPAFRASRTGTGATAG